MPHGAGSIPRIFNVLCLNLQVILEIPRVIFQHMSKKLTLSKDHFIL